MTSTRSLPTAGAREPSGASFESANRFLAPERTWRDFISDNERHVTNLWSMWGWDCLTKVGRKWALPDVAGCTDAFPLFKTKSEAHDALTRFVCDAIPLRAQQRFELAQVSR